MKIALIGAQGVGKTTAGTAIKEQVSNSILVRESVRECPYPCDQNADFKTEWWILSHSILAEQEAREAKSSLVITDRCLLDISVYTKLIHGTGDGRISTTQKKMIDNSINQWFDESPYDLMFFMKVSPEVWKKRDLDDGFRSTDLGWYLKLTEEFELVLKNFNIAERTRLVEIHNDGNFSKALSQITEEIQRIHTKKNPGAKNLFANL